MQPGRAAGHLPHPRRALPSVHASERRRVQASDARSGRPPGAPDRPPLTPACKDEAGVCAAFRPRAVRPPQRLDPIRRRNCQVACPVLLWLGTSRSLWTARRAGVRHWPHGRSRAPEGGLPRRVVRGRRTAALGPGVLAAGPASTDPTPRSRRARLFTSSQRSDTFASGSTVGATYEVGRCVNGGASDIGGARSSEGRGPTAAPVAGGRLALRGQARASAAWDSYGLGALGVPELGIRPDRRGELQPRRGLGAALRSSQPQSLVDPDWLAARWTPGSLRFLDWHPSIVLRSGSRRRRRISAPNLWSTTARRERSRGLRRRST